MKKISVALATLAILLAMAAAAWAGRSDLLSEPELIEIESIARAAYPKDTQLYMVVGDDLLGRYVVIEFIIKTKTQRPSLELMVYPLTAYAKMSSAESAEMGERVGVKIIRGIEKILNKSPRQALENILE